MRKHIPYVKEVYLIKQDGTIWLESHLIGEPNETFTQIVRTAKYLNVPYQAGKLYYKEHLSIKEKNSLLTIFLTQMRTPYELFYKPIYRNLNAIPYATVFIIADYTTLYPYFYRLERYFYLGLILTIIAGIIVFFAMVFIIKHKETSIFNLYREEIEAYTSHVNMKVAKKFSRQTKNNEEVEKIPEAIPIE